MAEAVVPRLTRSTSSLKRKNSEETSNETPPVKLQKVKSSVSDDSEKKGTGDRPKCKYGAKCFRKSADHLKNFKHPPKRQTSKNKKDSKDDDEEMDTTESTTTRTGRVSKPPTAFTYTNPPAHKNIPQVLLAHKWTESVNPIGWWISEKLDGLRAYWDGKHFFSRLGNSFHAPDWFIENLPSDMELDGELFGGRGKFQTAISIVKSGPSDRWKNIKFHIFDAPGMGASPFEDRVKHLTDHFTENPNEYAVVIEHTKCKGADHIKKELKRVEALGAEGLMIRKPKSKYFNGRSDTLLKIKTFHDAEAVVIGYVATASHKCGSLLCRMENGKTFKAGSGMTEKDRANPPKKGSIITYRFQEYTNSGSPRFPTFVGVRIDATKPKDAILPKKPTDD